MKKRAQGVRYAEEERETQETRVRVVLDLDGERKPSIETGIGFLDHVLDLMVFHGGFDCGISAEGDLHVDDHHTVEDVGICFGRALRSALGDAEGISRYGSECVPMDEALVMVCVDVSGRAYLAFDVPFTHERIGDLNTDCIEEFFRAVANNAGVTIHVRTFAGKNNHHLCEATFKAFGRALRKAVARTDATGVPSTKGSLG
ncbi:MAG: imidazoleglycerol-phosphate dehydratase HisB [Armatimonadota bacterium]